MRTLMLICLVSLTGCLGGMSRGSTTTTYMHDNGHGVIERTVATHESSGTSVGGAVPLGMGGYYHGMPIVNGYGMLHNDERTSVYQTTLYRPTVVVSHGSNGAVTYGGGSYAASGDVSDLEARLAQLEELVPKIWGGTIQSLHQTCLLAIAHPDAIKDEVQRAAVVKDCEAFLAAEAVTNQEKE